jgi:hypothetical protein
MAVIFPVFSCFLQNENHAARGRATRSRNKKPGAASRPGGLA